MSGRPRVFFCALQSEARPARTKADESDDDELLQAALEAERRLALPSTSTTVPSEEDLTYTESNWAVHTRRRSCPSTLLYSRATRFEETL